MFLLNAEIKLSQSKLELKDFCLVSVHSAGTGHICFIRYSITLFDNLTYYLLILYILDLIELILLFIYFYKSWNSHGQETPKPTIYVNPHLVGSSRIQNIRKKTKWLISLQFTK